jgi:hypothetical protein
MRVGEMVKPVFPSSLSLILSCGQSFFQKAEAVGTYLPPAGYLMNWKAAQAEA